MVTIKSVMDSKELVDLVVTRVKAPNVQPTLTAAVIGQAIDLLKVGHKGYTDIASEIGFAKISRRQVKRVHQAMRERISELKVVE